MPSGGHARSGPPPDPHALRRDRDGHQWARLPKAGRKEEPPAWPLADPTTRELALWALEWQRPQALMWEYAGRGLEVALYVRAVVVAEGAKATAADRNVVLRQQTELGLNETGLRANRWVIVDDVDRQSEQAPKRPAPKPSARDRFTVVDGTG